MTLQCKAVTMQSIVKSCKRFTTVVINLLGWDVLSHAAYSPDMALSDRDLFRSVHHHFSDTHLSSVEKAEKSIAYFINSKPPLIYREGIRKLPEGNRSKKAAN